MARNALGCGRGVGRKVSCQGEGAVGPHEDRGHLEGVQSAVLQDVLGGEGELQGLQGAQGQVGQVPALPFLPQVIGDFGYGRCSRCFEQPRCARHQHTRARVVQGFLERRERGRGQGVRVPQEEQCCVGVGLEPAAEVIGAGGTGTVEGGQVGEPGQCCGASGHLGAALTVAG
jgi:hypothetical protein